MLRKELGLRVLEEEVLGEGAISIDALIMPSEGSGQAPIAVEVDGPYHFFTNQPQEPTGRTVFKRRLMDLAVQRRQLGGWVSVPYWAWQGVNTDVRKQQQLVCELLSAKGLGLEGYR